MFFWNSLAFLIIQYMLAIRIYNCINYYIKSCKCMILEIIFMLHNMYRAWKFAKLIFSFLFPFFSTFIFVPFCYSIFLLVEVPHWNGRISIVIAISWWLELWQSLLNCFNMEKAYLWWLGVKVLLKIISLCLFFIIYFTWMILLSYSFYVQHSFGSF